MNKSTLHLVFWDPNLDLNFYRECVDINDEILIFSEILESNISKFIKDVELICQQVSFYEKYNFKEMIAKLSIHHKTWTWK